MTPSLSGIRLLLEAQAGWLAIGQSWFAIVFCQRGNPAA